MIYLLSRSLPMNSESTECVDDDTGGEVAPSQVVVVDEAAVDPASDGVVLLAPCAQIKNKYKIKKFRENGKLLETVDRLIPESKGWTEKFGKRFTNTEAPASFSMGLFVWSDALHAQSK